MASHMCLTARANFSGSPWPPMCMKYTFGSSKKKWLCRPVTSRPPAKAASMAGVTSSWKTTVSPMTMAPCFVGVKAAQEPRPAAGLKAMPSTVTATSVRAQPRRTTPSGVVVALLPAALPIFSSSSLEPGPAEAHQPMPPSRSTRIVPRTILGTLLAMIVSFVLDSSSVSRDWQERDTLGRFPDLSLAQRSHLPIRSNLDALQGAVADIAEQDVRFAFG